MDLIWLIIGFPLAGAIINGLVLRGASPRLSHAVGSAALLAAFVCAVMKFAGFLSSGAQSSVIHGFTWIQVGDFSAPFSLVWDRLSAMMTLIVTGIGSLIHIYAGGYMHEEKRTARFFSYLNLFVFMMLLLVLGDNLLVMFVGWEGVGLCSYLLIGYWYSSSDNAAAGMKAFLVNRIGDIGFLLGIFLTHQLFGTISFTELREIIMAGVDLTPTTLSLITVIALCLFVGACGKSAQIPLYIWLPDAMAGPTPVSALIHAATMVTAGIYMMTRLNFLFYMSPVAMEVVAVVGGVTALVAATIALVQTDIKKVLAYSTVSQLGYMVMACGVGAFGAGFFHVFTHACFKALLFMGAGSVIVAMHHEQDMRRMGGLKKYMPITHIVFLIGVLAIIGFPGLSGFFSKDEILYKTFKSGHHVLWAIGALTAGLTSFYMVRLLCLTFYGKHRGANDQGHHEAAHGHGDHGHHEPHETSAVMWAPLIVLAILSATVGYLGIPPAFHAPNLLGEWFSTIIQVPEQAKNHWAYIFKDPDHTLEWSLMGVSTLIMAVASLTAVSWYKDGFSKAPIMLGSKFRGVYDTLLNKYWVDEAYDQMIVTPLKNMSLFLYRVFDVVVIDGIVNSVGQACLFIGGLTSFRMSGSVHRHAMVMIIGFVCLVTILLF